MQTTNIVEFARRDDMTDALTDLLRTGAQELIATAVEAKFAAYLAQFAELRTEAGHAAAVRNGHHHRPDRRMTGNPQTPDLTITLLSKAVDVTVGQDNG